MTTEKSPTDRRQDQMRQDQAQARSAEMQPATTSSPIARMRARFLELGRPVSATVRITPDLARALLETNVDNRPINQRIVGSIASDITEGRYSFNGESIVISEDGDLNDGQHRLWAVVEADKPIESIVVYGVARSSRTTVDNGTARTPGQLLGMTGVKNSVTAATIANNLLRWDSGSMYSRQTRYLNTKAAVMDYYAGHREEIDRAAGKIQNTSFRSLGGQGFIGFMMVLTTRAAGEELSGDFWKGVSTGSDLQEDSPVLYLRNRLLRDTRLPLPSKIELVVRCWNAWREGRTFTRNVPVTGSIPEFVKERRG